jgi:hypothetical protein
MYHERETFTGTVCAIQCCCFRRRSADRLSQLTFEVAATSGLGGCHVIVGSAAASGNAAQPNYHQPHPTSTEARVSSSRRVAEASLPPSLCLLECTLPAQPGRGLVTQVHGFVSLRPAASFEVPPDRANIVVQVLGRAACRYCVGDRNGGWGYLRCLRCLHLVVWLLRLLPRSRRLPLRVSGAGAVRAEPPRRAPPEQKPGDDPPPAAAAPTAWCTPQAAPPAPPTGLSAAAQAAVAPAVTRRLATVARRHGGASNPLGAGRPQGVGGGKSCSQPSRQLLRPPLSIHAVKKLKRRRNSRL